MNTVKIIKNRLGYTCEFHSFSLIASENYDAFSTGDMANAAAEWCARTPVALEVIEAEGLDKQSKSVNLAVHQGHPEKLVALTQEIKMRTPLKIKLSRWAWMMEWCRLNGLAAAYSDNWNRAEMAWIRHEQAPSETGM